MSGRHWRLLAVLGLVIAATMPTAAHHSIASEYEFESEIELTGVLARMDWINPHPILHLDVTDDGGNTTRWIIQSANSLLGTGATSDLRRAPKQGGLASGKSYTIFGFPAKNGRKQAFMKSITMPDGRVVTTWFGDPNG
jgi:hypothetical protein